MNSKILIAAVLGGFLFFGGKKPKSKATPTPDKEDEDIVEEDTEGEQEEQEEEEKPPGNNSKPVEYKTLTVVRRKVIDDFLNAMPILTSELGPDNDYKLWGSALQQKGIKPLYQNYLANQAYWHISDKEGKTDVYTDLGGINPPGYDGSLPFLLQKGKKATISKGGPWVDVFEFGESQDDANKRLAKGIALWKDIKKYIDDNIDLDSCPQGVVCK